MTKYQKQQALRLVFDEHGADEARRIAQQAPATLLQCGTEYDVVMELAKTGIALRDMRCAVDATARIVSRFAVDALDAAQFVGAAAAIGRLHAEDLLLLPTLFGYAHKA